MREIKGEREGEKERGGEDRRQERGSVKRRVREVTNKTHIIILIRCQVSVSCTMQTHGL